MNKVLEECIKKYNGELVCPRCGSKVQLLPELDVGEWQAYKCLCHPKYGWGYVKDLSIFNGWTILTRIEKMLKEAKLNKNENSK